MAGRDWRRHELDPALHQLNRRPRRYVKVLLPQKNKARLPVMVVNLQSCWRTHVNASSHQGRLGNVRTIPFTAYLVL
ncbi:hypothetical protein SCA6_005624 [Theobroma cacao]